MVLVFNWESNRLKFLGSWERFGVVIGLLQVGHCGWPGARCPVESYSLRKKRQD